mmetsp:Transcript_55294/g.161357  ORF Transcript_55294/g.161357 Transcript_55294/m.161357 type:complete len:172 (+) Transcript_55294:86-601(+)
MARARLLLLGPLLAGASCGAAGGHTCQGTAGSQRRLTVAGDVLLQLSTASRASSGEDAEEANTTAAVGHAARGLARRLAAAAADFQRAHAPALLRLLQRGDGDPNGLEVWLPIGLSAGLFLIGIAVVVACLMRPKAQTPARPVPGFAGTFKPVGSSRGPRLGEVNRPCGAC